MKNRKTEAPKVSVYEIVTEKIVAALDKGVVPWQRPWRVDGLAPMNLASKREYRGANVLLLSLAQAALPNATPWWLSFKQAHDLGGAVKKGEKGTVVLFWKKTSFKKKDEETGEEATKGALILRYYTVFNLSQTEGIDPKKVPAMQAAKTAKEIAADAEREAEKLVKGYQNPPKINHEKQQRAYYSPSADRVVMPPRESFASAGGYWGTLFHELAHSTGHQDRLGRKSITSTNAFGTPEYAREELVAEIGAAFLASIAGIEPDYDNSAAYIANWRKAIANDDRLIVMAAAQAQKAADWIRGLAEEQKVEVAA